MLGLLLPNSLRYSQYAFKYAQILDEHGVDYEFVYWNRDGMPLDVGRAFFFDEQMDDFLPLRNKGSMLLKYASFAKKTIRERAYNGLIVFTSQMAVMLMPMLLGPYKDRYIFDYRDISYEKIVPYRLAVAAIARRSRFTSISSPAFRDVIGAGSSSFIISHNERGAFCENPQKALSNDKLIRIAFWGIIRQPDFNKLVCRRIGSDDRFSLTYHGSGCSKELEDYCVENGFYNVRFTGIYDESYIDSFVQTTDLLLNAYANDAIQKSAFTVKYYDSLKYGIPMLVTEGSAMSESVHANRLGIAVDWDDPRCADYIYWSYMNFDRSRYLEGRDREVARIKADDGLFEEKLIEFVASLAK